MFTTEHYNAIADVIDKVAAKHSCEPVNMSAKEAVLLDVVSQLTQMFARDNSNFSPTLFFTNCLRLYRSSLAGGYQMGHSLMPNLRRADTLARDQRRDDRKWEAAKALVAAYNDWQKAVTAHGTYSEEATNAFNHVKYCNKVYNRLRIERKS